MIEAVTFTAEASAEVKESYNWYEEREPGLGEEFLRTVEACVKGIQRQPKMYPIAVAQFRRAPIRRFPFEIFYEESAAEIVVYAVFHCSQDPEKWRARLNH